MNPNAYMLSSIASLSAPNFPVMKLLAIRAIVMPATIAMPPIVGVPALLR